MRDHYKITEIASLYGLCTDTLRYYEEQGLLHPTRDPENGYRLYGIQDICTLNVIRGLRKLGLSTAEIGAYLSGRTVQTTLELLRREDRMLSQKIFELSSMRAQVRQQARELRANQRIFPEQPLLETLPLRPCFVLSENVILEHEIDFFIKKLQKEHQSVLQALGTRQIGAVLNQEKLAQGYSTHFRSVFILGDDPAQCDTQLPAGIYASIYYKGEYGQAARMYDQLTGFLAQQGLEPAAAPMELYPIDAHHTLLHSEYLTQVQVLTRPAAAP